MTLLRSYSLIEGSDHSDGYATHAVVHRWAYFYGGVRHQSDMGMLALAVVGGAVPESTERDYARLQQRLLPHAQTCTARVLGPQAVTVQNLDFTNHFTHWANQQENVLDAIHRLGSLYSD